MSHVSRKLCNEGKMSGLSRRPLSSACEGKGQRLVVCVDCERSTLHKMTEVLNGEVYGQKLTIKCTVLSFGGGKLAGEKGNWMPVPSQELFQLTTNSFV